MGTLLPLYLAGVMATLLFFAWADDEQIDVLSFQILVKSMMWPLVMPLVAIRIFIILLKDR